MCSSVTPVCAEEDNKWRRQCVTKWYQEGAQRLRRISRDGEILIGLLEDTQPAR